MVRLSASVLGWLAAATASFSALATVHAETSPENAVPGAYILECDSSQGLEALKGAVKRQGGEIRREFNSNVFYGLSAQLPNASVAGEEVQGIPGVKKVWPVQVHVMKHQEKSRAESQVAQDPRHWRRETEAPWNHVMTQVDKMHRTGYKGSGIKIAVVDTGIDYTNPALGGCFGKGCRVALGDNFAKDGKANDPMDCHGHGTQVAGILAGSDANYVGVAPNATLAGYRVLDCAAEMQEDDLIAGWIKAYQDGAQIIVSSASWEGSSWATRPAAVVVSRIVDRGVPCIAAAGNDRRSLFTAGNPSSGRRVTSVSAFARAPGALDGHVRDAPMGQMTAYGPNWDLDVKPTVGAPGDDVQVITMGGGYKSASGTSYAGPLVAGIMALMAEARRTFDPVLLNRLLVTTAVPQGGFFSVAEQGGGLVRAWDAAHARTLLEPASLPFNDTQHRVQSLALRITNTANASVSYQLDTIAARTVYSLGSQKRLNRGIVPADESAAIKLSQRHVVLGPGESASINVSATDPQHLDRDRLPVWSGWIAINSSTGGLLTVPYLGVLGSLKEQKVLQPDGVRLETENKNFKYEIQNDGSLNLSLSMILDPVLGIRLARVEFVPQSPRKWLVDRLVAMNTTKLPAFTLESLQSDKPVRRSWDGRLESGDYIPAGSYKLAVRALRLFGDATQESDWDLAENIIPFSITRGGGKKACEMYKSSSASMSSMSQNALFSSYQECLQLHGNVLGEAPWIPAPRDKAVGDKCTVTPTEESCGTYRFCMAHRDKETDGAIKSPFFSWSECIKDHQFLPVKEKDNTSVYDCIKDNNICDTETLCTLYQSDVLPLPDEYVDAQECYYKHGLKLD